MSSNGHTHQATPTKVVPLLNSVVDVCLVYGIDETSARELQVNEEGDIHTAYDSLLQRDIKLHFLQVLTPGSVYPDRLSKGRTLSQSVGSPGAQNEGAPKAGGAPPMPEAELDGSFHVVQHKKFDMDKVGLPWEAVETVHWFMYPEGPQLSSEDVEPNVIPMMLTNIEGSRSYASGIRFYRPFFIQKSESSHFYKLIPWEESPQPPPNSRLVYLPTCVVLVSKKPHFQFQKDALSGFHRTLTNEEDPPLSFWHCVLQFTERLFLIPAPPPGLLSVECQLPGFVSTLIIKPPRGDQYLDIRLNYPFLCLSLYNVLQVISALLTEQRIIFTSSLYPMLTYVIQCFFAYITPFDWRLPCVPILPFLQIDYLDAVGTNIMGCHANMARTPEFQNMEDVVIVDLDNDAVICKLRDSSPLPPLPSFAVSIFHTRYEALQKQKFEVEQLRQLSHMSYEEMLREKAEFDRALDDCLSAMFLELMVNIYYNVTEELVESRVKFGEAVKELPPEDQAFYKYTNQTDMFSAFYQSRRQRIRDPFTLLAERIKRTQRKSLMDGTEESIFSTSTVSGHAALRKVVSAGGVAGMGPLLSSYVPGMTSTRSTYLTVQSPYKSSVSHPPTCGFEESAQPSSLTAPPSSLTSPQLANESVRVELPSLQEKTFSRDTFIEDAISSLSVLADNKSVRAQCLYLIAFYRICQGNILQALDDLYDNLLKMEIQLKPSASMTHQILSMLSEEQQKELKKKSYYKHLAPAVKKAGGGRGRHQTIVSHTSFNLDKKLPSKPVGINDFRKMVGENAIATDAESADNLFRILSQNRTSITPENFIAFYEAWKLVLQENANIDLLGLELEKGDKVRVQEKVIAVAEQARTPFGGQNMLVLTTYRFLAVTSFKTHVMADLRTPLRIDISDLPLGILPGSKLPGITIEKGASSPSQEKKAKESTTERVTARLTRTRASKNPNETFAGFQTVMDRDHWYRMLLEVQNGWKVSQARKDPGVMETVECHVVLLDAISTSGLLDRFNHTQRTKTMMKLMTLQAKDVSEVSQFTVEALQYRINPCLHETERQTVESLLYIPSMDPFETGLGKLWIGLGNGCLKVYDMDAKCFESNIKISDSKHSKALRLSCLLLVRQTVWVASFFSKNIHILDAETVVHVSQLSYLEEAPRDLALSFCNGQEVVWSLLVNGTLLAFDPDTRTRTCKMQVPISDDSQFFTVTCFAVWKQTLWVGTNRGTIAIMDTEDGKCVREIFFPGGRRKQVEIKHLALSNENEIWCSINSIPRGKDSIFLAVFDPNTFEKKLHYTNLDSRVAVILPVNNTMWCGTRSGKIYIFNSQEYSDDDTTPQILSAHEDIIRTMTLADNMVVSGSGSNDGYAAVWRALSS